MADSRRQYTRGHVSLLTPVEDTVDTVMVYVCVLIIDLHEYIGPTHRATPTRSDDVQSSVDSDGLTVRNKPAVIECSKQIPTQESPPSTTCHLPQLRVVPSATCTPLGDKTLFLVYPSMTPGGGISREPRVSGFHVPPCGETHMTLP